LGQFKARRKHRQKRERRKLVAGNRIDWANVWHAIDLKLLTGAHWIG
jgi:hypothetical protein